MSPARNDTYDQSARLTQRVDTTGVNTFTYNNRDQLASLTDAVTGTTRAYDYTDAAQTCLITYAQAAPTGSCTRATAKNTRAFVAVRAASCSARTVTGVGRHVG